MHAGLPFNRTIYTHKGGGSLLCSFQRLFNNMEAHILAIHQPVKAKGQQIKGKGEGQKILKEEVMS